MEETGVGGRWGAREEARAPGARGSVLPRESEGEGSAARHAPSLGPFSHISAGRGRISHALPCARRAAAAALPGPAARRRGRPARSTSGKGGEEGTRALGGWRGRTSRGVSALPPSSRKAKAETRTEEPSALAPASPRWPRVRGARMSGFL